MYWELSHCDLLIIPPQHQNALLGLTGRLRSVTTVRPEQKGLSHLLEFPSVGAWMMQWHRTFWKPWQNVTHAGNVRFLCLAFLHHWLVYWAVSSTVHSELWLFFISLPLYQDPWCEFVTTLGGSYRGKTSIMMNGIQLTVSWNNLTGNKIFVKRAPSIRWIKTILQMIQCTCF